MSESGCVKVKASKIEKIAPVFFVSRGSQVARAIATGDCQKEYNFEVYSLYDKIQFRRNKYLIL